MITNDVSKLKVGTKFMLTGRGWNPAFVNIPSIVTEINPMEEFIRHYYLKDIMYRGEEVILKSGKLDMTVFSELERDGFEILDRKNTKPDWL